MTTRTPTWETPFRLAFESEAIIPVEIGLTNYRVSHHDERRNKEEIRLQLDLLDEVRGIAEQRVACYQDLMAKHYNAKAKPRHFQIEDLDLRKMTTATKDPAQGKLGPNWEGPNRIFDYHRKGTYHLETLDRKRLHHPCNAEHL